MDRQSGIAGVIEASWPYWQAEFEIGYAALGAANIYSETAWLAGQIWKEWSGSGVYGPAGTDLQTVAASATAEEELSHYHSLEALGSLMDVPPADYVPGEAAMALASYRNAIWPDQTLRHGVRMSEGGGLGLFHGAIAGIEARGAGRAQDVAVRDTLASIIADEAGHLGGAIGDFIDAAVEGEAPVFAVLTRCLYLKVAERREQFGAQMNRAVLVPDAAVAAYRKAITALLRTI